ncbi:cell death protein 3-like isoform X2 [Biomphalaria glabrata]|uniref:Cell death protein 3-like isoform X2 n=1 Tax=Biomphalaria glabrata TaxID=6526 RepID=A0A9W2YR83_BIOGL|nr:cell death protein 3-like isoform X2 [Biomphalaria glabrata]
MLPAHKDRIQDKFTLLIEQIRPQVEIVCLSLLNKHKIINTRMCEDILEENKAPSKRAQKLLQTIVTRGPNAFQKLYESVLEAELYDAADTLMPENKPHWPDDSGGSNVQPVNGIETSQSDAEKKRNDEIQPSRYLETSINTEATNSIQDPKSKNEPNDVLDAIPRSKDSGSNRDETFVKEIYRETEVKVPVSCTLDSQPRAQRLLTDQIDALLWPEGSHYIKELQSKTKRLPSSIIIESEHLSKSPAADRKPSAENSTTFPSDFSTSLDEIKLPDTWPSKEHIAQLKTTSVQLVKSNSKLAIMYQNLNTDQVYTLTYKTRGHAVIIDNKNFLDLDIRFGSEEDRKSSQKLFEELGFIVSTYCDLTKEQMLETLRKESERIEAWHQCFVLVILSHGAKGCVFGTDGEKSLGGDDPVNAISVEDIREMFCKVPNLYNKPKLFFIQACRGGVASWRVTTYGSWFIQAVVFVFTHFAHLCDLNELMLKVNDLVSKAITSKGFKQVPENYYTLRKKFFFFPGLGEERH